MRKILASFLVLISGVLYQSCEQPPQDGGSQFSSQSNCPANIEQSFIYVNGVRLESTTIDISMPRDQSFQLSWGRYGQSFACGPSDSPSRVPASQPTGYWSFSDNYTVADYCASRRFSTNGTYTATWTFLNSGTCGARMTAPVLRIHIAN